MLDDLEAILYGYVSPFQCRFSSAKDLMRMLRSFNIGGSLTNSRDIMECTGRYFGQKMTK